MFQLSALKIVTGFQNLCNKLLTATAAEISTTIPSAIKMLADKKVAAWSIPILISLANFNYTQKERARQGPLVALRFN